MASCTLYTYQGSFRANKILIAAEYSGAKVTVDPNFEYGKTNTSPEFLKKFPLGKVPAFESNDACFNESNAIAQYVSNETLLGGSNSADRAAVTEYISFSENEILPSACTWVYPTLGFKQYNKQDTDKAQQHLKKCLSKLNDDLLTKTFLVGERVTLADITLCTSLAMLYVQVLDPKFRETYQNVNRWFITCVNQPNFKKVLGDVKLCEKMAVFDNKRYQELHPKASKDKPKKEKQEKPKEKAKEKPEAAPEAVAVAAAPPKKIDYFAHVPPTKFVLDQWKKEYTNNYETSFKWLEDNFDSNALSIWYCEYMIPNDDVKRDLVLGFMTDNAMRGLIQRIEGLRKHCYGMLMSFKEEEPEAAIPKYHSICGVWIFRGQDVAFRLNDDWNVDACYYDFQKLDITNADDNKLLKNLLAGINKKGAECENCIEFK